MKPIAILAISVLISIPTTLHAQTKRIPVAYSAVSAYAIVFLSHQRSRAV